MVSSYVKKESLINNEKKILLLLVQNCLHHAAGQKYTDVLMLPCSGIEYCAIASYVPLDRELLLPKAFH